MHFTSIQDNFLLNNDSTISCVGFGTWQTPDGKTAIDAVVEAVKAGYRHIDTAAVYGNEKSIGEAIKKCGAPREELFITSKLWNTERGYESTKKAFEKTLADLDLAYLDLYLIHWPANKKQFENPDELNLQTWRAMEDLYEAGKIRAIGLSNFLPHHMEVILKQGKVRPAIDQLEFHPGYMQKAAVDFCQAEKIVVQAWSPLGTGEVLAHPLLVELGEKYKKSPAQICIRWVLQHDVLPLPKSVTPSRIIENTQVFDFEITEADMDAIDKMPFAGGQANHPDEADF